MPLRCRMVRGQGQYTHTSSLVHFHIDRVDNLGTDYCNPRRWRYLLGQSSNTSRICPGELRTHNLHIFVDKDRWTGKHWYLTWGPISKLFTRGTTNQGIILALDEDPVFWEEQYAICNATAGAGFCRMASRPERAKTQGHAMVQLRWHPRFPGWTITPPLQPVRAPSPRRTSMGPDSPPGENAMVSSNLKMNPVPEDGCFARFAVQHCK